MQYTEMMSIIADVQGSDKSFALNVSISKEITTMTLALDSHCLKPI